MSKTRPHTDMDNTAMPKTGKQLGNFPSAPSMPYEGGHKRIAGKPHQPSGEVSRQSGSHGGSSPHPKTPYERGFNPDLGHRRERNPPGGSQKGMHMSDVYSAMPKTGHQSATAPGMLARPGSEPNSRGMDARSSVPASIQEGPNTRDRMTSLDYGKVRYDNAEIDDGCGTGRRMRGTFRGNRRM